MRVKDDSNNTKLIRNDLPNMNDLGEPHELEIDDIIEADNQEQHRIRPVRDKKPPVWSKDYVCSACDTYNVKYPMQ